MKIIRRLPTYLLALSVLLTSLPVAGLAVQPVVARGQDPAPTTTQTPAPTAPPAQSPATAPTTTSTGEIFKFGKVDLDLLDQVNLLDRTFEKEGLVYHDDMVDAYLERVGRSVTVGKQPENVVWRFHALRDPVPNAIALPNGSIYINTGLLALLEDEGQLAGVMAHEAIHVINRHSYLQNRSMRKKILAINILGTIAMWNPVGGVAGTAINIIANISPLLLTLSIFGYSRELEKEADVEGLKNLTAADYYPEEMVNSFKQLQKDIEGEQIDSFYSDHPKLQERVNYLSASVGNANRMSEELLKKAKADYLSIMEGVDRHDVELAILSERFRTAVYISQKLVDFHPDSSTNLYYLAESYRALGPRTPALTAKELSGGEKKKAAKNRARRTLEEQDAELMKTVAGQEAWKANQVKAEQLYQQALDLNRFNFRAHRGLGMLYEKLGRKEDAIHAYSKYLELAPPTTADVERFKRRREILKASVASETNAPKPPQPQENHR